MNFQRYLLLLFISCTSALEWGDLRCTFSALDIFHIDSFFQQPRTLPDAQKKGWVEPPEGSSQKNLKIMCEKNDARVCLLFDKQGYIAAYQVSIPKIVDSLKMPGIDYTRMQFKETKLFGQPQYTFTAYLVPQNTISSGGRVWDGQTGEGLWLPINGRLVEIPRQEKDLISAIPEFKKQNCYPKMGMHYFYNLTRDLRPEDFQAPFLLYSKKGELHGFGLNAFGSEAVHDPFIEYIPFFKKRNWFENVPVSKIRSVAPDAPQWSLDYKTKYGGYSHHVYFVRKPWNIDC